MESVLDPRTQLLVALGAAVAAKCQSCFVKLYGMTNEAGVTDRDVRAVVAIATKVTAKSHEFMAAFVDEATSGNVKAGSGIPSAAGCGCS